MMTYEQPLVSLVIVNYNGKKFLEKAFLSAKQQTYPRHEVICVDNASNDGSAAYIREQFPWVRLVEAENKGYGSACNRGAEVAIGEFVYFLNEDMHTPPDFVERYIDTYRFIEAKDPSIGAIACTEDKYDGGRRPDVYPGKVDCFGYIAPNKTSNRLGAFIPGCPFFIRRDLFLKSGGFCEHIFLYGDDSDLSWRLTIMGKNNYAAPEIRLYHWEGASLVGFPPKKIYYLVHASMIGLFNNYSLLSLSVFLPLNILFNMFVITPGLLLTTRNVYYVWAVFKAMGDFFLKIPRLWLFRRNAQRIRTISDWFFIRKHMMIGSSFVMNKSWRRL